MEQHFPTKGASEPLQNPLVIKVFGVGNAGINVMEQMIRGGVSGAEFAAVNTETRSVAESSAAKRLHLDTKILCGLGTGGDPELGRALAEEHLPELKAACAGAGMVFIVAGLGGGAGTGISPVLARAAKEAGALALAFVTTPFACEGGRRQRLAQHGLEALKAAADGVVCLPNQKVFKLIDENTSVLETFKITGGMLAEAVRGVWRLLAQPGLIEIHFADLSALIRERHSESFFAVAEAMGPTRSRDVVDKLLAHPMLDDGRVLTESDALLVSLTGGPDLTMAEINRVMEQLNRHCERAQVIMGAAIDESFRDRLAVTLIAARKTPAQPEPEGRMAGGHEDLDTQLLARMTTARRGSRFVPPAPSLPQDKMEQLLARQGVGSGRGRRGHSKLKQTQLPLEIVAKGRFDKSEPTIHRGEDLDVPTYLRRGVALN